MNTLTASFLIIGGALAIALCGMWIVRRTISPEALESNHEVAGYMLSIVGTLYAILLGLIVVNVQTKFEVANTMAVTEANCLSDIAHLSAIYPEATRKKVFKELFDYATAARDQDWALVSSGQAKEATIPSYRSLWKTINHMELKGSKEESAYSNLLSTMSQLSDARRFRMVAGHNGLSPILWAVLIVGELLIVWFTYFFFVKSLKAQAIMTIFVVVFLSLNLVLVYLYDNPYRSELGAQNAGVTFRPEWFAEEPSAGESGAKEAPQNDMTDKMETTGEQK